MDEEKLLERILQYMKDWMLLRLEDEHVILLPAVGKLKGYYPKDYNRRREQMNSRWKMNRIGFVNFWLYDEEEFWFENGRLLLRGQNGSGKSITTQSFYTVYSGRRPDRRADWILLAPVTGGWNIIFSGKRERRNPQAICFLNLRWRERNPTAPSESDRGQSAADRWISGISESWTAEESDMICCCTGRREASGFPMTRGICVRCWVRETCLLTAPANTRSW